MRWANACAYRDSYLTALEEIAESHSKLLNDFEEATERLGTLEVENIDNAARAKLYFQSTIVTTFVALLGICVAIFCLVRFRTPAERT